VQPERQQQVRRCCCRGRRVALRHRRLDILHVAGARNADAQIVLLDFDFRQVRVVEDVREIADQCLIDTVFLLSHECLPCLLFMP
jgi:hypothetical protein